MATGTQTDLIPELKDGDHLSVAEFERRYHAAPRIKKAELIEGVVHVASPVSELHGEPHSSLNFWLVLYRAGTSHVIVSTDTTVKLDISNQPQPDIYLRIANRGGQSSRTDEGYLQGAPELVAEISLSTVAKDLGPKLEAYRHNGVREAIIWRVLDRAIDWFILREGRFDRLTPGADGWHRSDTFPGLWLDAKALIQGDLTTVFESVRRGLASQEHARFVETLERACGY